MTLSSLLKPRFFTWDEEFPYRRLSKEEAAHLLHHLKLSPWDDGIYDAILRIGDTPAMEKMATCAMAYCIGCKPKDLEDVIEHVLENGYRRRFGLEFVGEKCRKKIMNKVMRQNKTSEDVLDEFYALLNAINEAARKAAYRRHFEAYFKGESPL